MKIKMIILIIDLLLTDYGFCQTTFWILSSVEQEDDFSLRKNMHNRLFLRLTDSTLSIFDSGKEDWEGDFKTTFSYVKSDNFMAINSSKGVIDGEYNNDTTLRLTIKNEKYIFIKIQERKNDKIYKAVELFLDNNVFVSKLSWGPPDTVVFNNSSIELSGPNNLTYKLIRLDKFILLNLSFEGSKLYPISKYSKSEIVLQRFDKDWSKISFRIVDKKRSDYPKKEMEMIQF